MKKIISIILIIYMLLAFCACEFRMPHEVPLATETPKGAVYAEITEKNYTEAILLGMTYSDAVARLQYKGRYLGRGEDASIIYEWQLPNGDAIRVSFCEDSDGE